MSQLIVCGARLWTHVTYGVDQACPNVAVQRIDNGQGAGVAFTPNQKSRGEPIQGIGTFNLLPVEATY